MYAVDKTVVPIPSILFFFQCFLEEYIGLWDQYKKKKHSIYSACDNLTFLSYALLIKKKYYY